VAEWLLRAPSPPAPNRRRYVGKSPGAAPGGLGGGWLAVFRDSAAVRIGNGASNQLQLATPTAREDSAASGPPRRLVQSDDGWAVQIAF